MRSSEASSCEAQSQSQPHRLSLVTHEEWTRANSGSRVATSPSVSASAGRRVERFWNQCVAKAPWDVSIDPAPVSSSEPKLRSGAALRPSGGMRGSSRIVLALAHGSKVGDEPVQLL